MTAARSTVAGGARNYDPSTDSGEIQGMQASAPRELVARAHLLPGELAASLPPAAPTPDLVFAPLMLALGKSRTTENGVWEDKKAVRLMRSLQKRLVGFSLTLEEGERWDCMEAINVVEAAVQQRLRLQQMCMMIEELTDDSEEG